MQNAAKKGEVGVAATDEALLAMLRVLDPASSATHRLQVLVQIIQLCEAHTPPPPVLWASVASELGF